jgi:uncharacterized membrane protein YeaQ/YmgE (transglycosylase-associated protein family)
MDIYSAANLVIRSVIEAARMTDSMLELGDPDGEAMCRPIRRAIEVLQARRVGWCTDSRRSLIAICLRRHACRQALQKGQVMSILGWIVLGLIAGFIASKIVNRQGEGFFLDIILGIVGGVVGGWLFERFGGTGVTGFNLWSMFVAVIGAVVVLVVYHAIRRVT